MTRTPTLTDMMSEGQVVMGGAYDCISAAICQSAGFPALMLGGAGIAASSLGVPDLGLLTFGDLVPVVSNIVASVNIPCVVDIDTGYGNELNVARTVERIVKTGVIAMHLEDQTFPKRCGHMAGKTVIDRAEYIRKVRIAAEVLEGTGVQLIARTDSFATHGVDEAVARCLESLEAGAHISFAEAPDSVEGVTEIARRVPGHKMFSLATGGANPPFTFAELAELGFNLVSNPGLAFLPAIAAMRESAAAVLRDGSDKHVEQFGLGPRDLFKTVGLDRWEDMERRVATWS